MNQYSATFPIGADLRDLAATVLASLPAAPDLSPTIIAPNTITVTYIARVLTPAQIAAFQSAAAAPFADPNAPYRVLDADRLRLQGVPAVLRAQAQTAAGITVTSGNAVTVLQTVVNDLAIFCNRLADLIEALQLN